MEAASDALADASPEALVAADNDTEAASDALTAASDASSDAAVAEAFWDAATLSDAIASIDAICELATDALAAASDTDTDNNSDCANDSFSAAVLAS